MFLRTATGKEYMIGWIGVASIDGVLRFGILGGDSTDVFSTFTNRNETNVLTRIFDGVENSYYNYTVFKSIDVEPDGSIIVALGRK